MAHDSFYVVALESVVILLLAAVFRLPNRMAPGAYLMLFVAVGIGMGFCLLVLGGPLHDGPVTRAIVDLDIANLLALVAVVARRRSN